MLSLSLNSNKNERIPPFRFSCIQPHLYRGGFPKPRNYFWLQRLKLKTMVTIVPYYPKELSEFCKQENIEMKYFAVDRPKENLTLSPKLVYEILPLLVDESNFPLYIHCLDGIQITGLIIGCLRKLQLWNPPFILSEYTRFTRDGVISVEESEFMESFHFPYCSSFWVQESADGLQLLGSHYQSLSRSSAPSNVPFPSMPNSRPLSTISQSTISNNSGSTKDLELNLSQCTKLSDWLFPLSAGLSLFSLSCFQINQQFIWLFHCCHPFFKIKMPLSFIQEFIRYVQSQTQFQPQLIETEEERLLLFQYPPGINKTTAEKRREEKERPETPIPSTDASVVSTESSLMVKALALEGYP